MKKLGIVGGIGPESTIDYYRMFVKEYQAKMNDGSYPEVVINCIDMTKMLGFVGRQEWQLLIDYLVEAVDALAKAGAEFGIIASNTPHIVFDELQSRLKIPLLSIVQETCKKVQEHNIKKIALFGTGFTMKSDYYQKVFNNNGITVIVPNQDEQQYIQNKIFSELQLLKIVDKTKEGLLSIVKRMKEEEDIEGVILGCTELPLILKEDTYGIKFINTSEVHVKSALKQCFLGSVR